VPEAIPGSGFEIAADLVVNALGFAVADAAVLTGGTVAMTPQGRVAADRQTRMTAADGVFVAGDARLGPSLVVWAIREGREVAAAVAAYLAAAPARPMLETGSATSSQFAETATGSVQCG